jgi:hypothetical protein
MNDTPTTWRSSRTVFTLASAVLLVAASARAADEGEGKKYTIAAGKFELTAPANWIVKQPRVRIIDSEFEAPKAEGDDRPGRITVMGAGGSIDANIDRWIGQFTQPDGSSSKEAAKVKKLTVAGQAVHVVDIAGTYLDKPPFAGGGVERKDYRMLAAIIETTQGGKKTGNYFIKFIGPAHTVADNEAGFQKMIESLSAK